MGFHLICAALLTVAHAWAQSADLDLTPSVVDTLSPEARAHYDEAIQWNQRTDRQRTLSSLFRAADAAPDCVALQLLATRVAIDLAHSQSDPIAALEKAAVCVGRVTDSDDASSAQKIQADIYLGRLQRTRVEESQHLDALGETSLTDLQNMMQPVERRLNPRPQQTETTVGAVRRAGVPSQGFPDTSGATYIGNSNTRKFHTTSCFTLRNMAPAHEVSLSSCQDAFSRGFDSCGHCEPCQ
jgi:hypothetical protein